MTEPEDPDVDSGWDVGDEDEEAAPMTRAVDSARLLADAGLAAIPSRKNVADEAPVTPRAESLPSIEAAPISEQPATRRASDDELSRVRDRSKPPQGSPLRLGGRKHTPLVTDAATRARSLDASAEASRRPTPSTLPPVGAALRFPVDGTKALREAHRRPTVINKAVREPDPLAQTAEAPAKLLSELVTGSNERSAAATPRGTAPRKESAPVGDLDIPDAFDLMIDGPEPAPKAPGASLSFDDLDDVGTTSRRGPTKVTAPAIPKAIKATAEAAASALPDAPATAVAPSAPTPNASVQPAGGAKRVGEVEKATARGIDRKALAAELAARRQSVAPPSGEPTPKPPAAAPPAAKIIPPTAAAKVAPTAQPKAVGLAPKPVAEPKPLASGLSKPPPSQRGESGAAPPNKLAVPRLGAAKPPATAPRPGVAPKVDAPPAPAPDLLDDFDLGPIEAAPTAQRSAPSAPADDIDLEPPPAPSAEPAPVSEEPDMVASARVALESLESLEMFEERKSAPVLPDSGAFDLEIPAAAPSDSGTIDFEIDEAVLSEEEQEALALSEREPDEATISVDVEEEPEDPELEPIRVRFEKGDYAGALLRAESLVEARPGFDAAQRYADSAREMLRQLYLEKLGSGEQVLRLAMKPDEIQGLTLDHRSGFLISFIDGTATVDEILDMSGMPQLDALRLLYEMRQQGVVAVDSMASP